MNTIQNLLASIFALSALFAPIWSNGAQAASPHMFNAHLLRPGENQLSIATNYKLGMSDQLQIGGNGLLALAGLVNGSLKHKLFDSPLGTTATNIHLFFSSALDAPTIGGFYGIIHTYPFSSSMDISGALYNFTAKSSEKFLAPNTLDMNLYSMSGAIDVYRGNLTYTGIIFLPLYSDLYQSDDTLEASLTQVELFSSTPSISPVFFGSVTITSGSFNFEPGVLVSDLVSSLYLNLFWKW